MGEQQYYDVIDDIRDVQSGEPEAILNNDQRDKLFRLCSVANPIIESEDVVIWGNIQQLRNAINIELRQGTLILGSGRYVELKRELTNLITKLSISTYSANRKPQEPQKRV